MLGVLAVWVAMLSPPADATSTLSNGSLAFTSREGIVVMEPDGSGHTVVAENRRDRNLGDVAFFDPAWSPDGRRLVVTRQSFPSHEYDELVVMDALGRHRSVLYTEANAWQPAWAPDGRRIAFTAFYSELDEQGREIEGLETILLGKEETAPLVQGPGGSLSDSSWSPDGSSVCFTRGRDRWARNTRIFVAPVDGSGQALASVQGASCDWAPDGQAIVFAGTDGLYIAEPNGANLRRVQGTQRGDREPTWAPDGTKLAFIRGVSANRPWGKLQTVDLATGETVTLTTGARMPDWRASAEN